MSPLGWLIQTLWRQTNQRKFIQLFSLSLSIYFATATTTKALHLFVIEFVDCSFSSNLINHRQFCYCILLSRYGNQRMYAGILRIFSRKIILCYRNIRSHFLLSKKKLIRTCSIKHELHLILGNLLSRFIHGMMFFLCFQFVCIFDISNRLCLGIFQFKNKQRF